MKKLLGLISKSYLYWTALLLTSPVLAQFTSPKPTPITSGSLQSVIDGISNAVAGLAGAIAVLFLIYGGIMYIVGGEAGSKSGRAIITNALIGLVVVVLAVIIVKFVLGAIE